MFKLINKTGWNARDLRAFIVRAAKDELPREKLARCRFTITHRRTSGAGCSGWATVGGFHATICVPKMPGPVDRIDLAHVIAHEMAHLRGLGHREMTTARYQRKPPRTREIFAWGETLKLRPVQAKKATRVIGVAADEAKLAHAEEMLAIWEKRIAAATKRAAAWRKRKRYYDGKIRRAATKVGSNGVRYDV